MCVFMRGEGAFVLVCVLNGLHSYSFPLYTAGLSYHNTLHCGSVGQSKMNRVTLKHAGKITVVTLCYGYRRGGIIRRESVLFVFIYHLFIAIEGIER